MDILVLKTFITEICLFILDYEDWIYNFIIEKHNDNIGSDEKIQ